MKVTLIMTVLSLLAAGALVISGVSLIMRFHETNAFKVRQDHAWHAVICDIEQQTVTAKSVSLPKKIAAVKFYDGLLVKDIHTAPCDIKLNP